MRFGQNFHQYMVPEWTPRYVPYDSVKSAFKLAVEKSIDVELQPDFSEVYTLLANSIQSFDTFHHETCNSLMKRQAKLTVKYEKLFGIIFLSRDEDDDFHEVKTLLQPVTELRNDFEKLQNFSQLNEEAIQRLFGKIEKLVGCNGPLHQDQKSRWTKSQMDRRTQYANFISRSRVLITSVNEASADGVGPSTMKGLLNPTRSKEIPPLLAQYSAFYRAIRNDEPSALGDPLSAFLRDPPSGQEPGAFLYELMELAVTCHSELCFRYLTSQRLSSNNAVLDHNLLNHVIVTESQLGTSEANKDLEDSIQCGNEGKRGFFQITIESLASRTKDTLFAKDTFGRTSLHYGALHGMAFICKSIVDYAQSLGQDSMMKVILMQDCQGLTPFHYAVIKDHVGVAKFFLETLVSELKFAQNAQAEGPLNDLNDILVLAIRYKHDEIVLLITETSFDFHGRSSSGETALYAAARTGRSDYVNMLLKRSNRVYIDTAEMIHGWTPLFIACAEGHHSIVKLLLHAGASQDLYDRRGWIAKEHAAFRGHLHVAELLKSWDPNHLAGGPANMPRKSKSPSSSRLPMGGNYVVVNLGVLRNGKDVEAVDFKGSSSTNSPNAKHITSMDMSISVESNIQRAKLPIISDMVNEPFVFPVTKPSEARLVFKFYPADSSCEACRLIGSAAYLLETDKDCFGENRESLVRERTVPILEKGTMDIIGTVTFTFVIAKPLMGPAPSHHFFLLLDLVLHMSNLVLADSSEALSSAFTNLHTDVQLTRDLFPVIYHDFSLSESGTDIPIHDLSLEQFMYASELQSPRGEPVSVLGRPNSQSLSDPTVRARVRSHSLTKSQEGETARIRDRMRHTVDFKNKGFKPNTRGHSVQDSFTTLQELLTGLPDSISFNIEIKYPRLHEAVEAGVGPLGIEINTFIDRILAQIFRVSSGRSVILSSFSPEVCILLATKQDIYPVMFITNAGKIPMSDMEMRASSLQAAVRFSKRWNLAGIVFASETLILCPRLVGYVKRSGLICGSYGSLNNIPEHAKAQHKAGLQILMVDNVRLIASTLAMKR
ncbi:hypothetical protein PENCOP_c009G03158 [Penicillium coprophilum]|uniref:SPX domain-containing protein n=1 Tax=Penicillium coprophilum TaxID=36646 RepID=A0A1V6UHF8_9EURO|nr:hypothetical protein PENCOP_c009G03158 [Penicillium coprophilum]